MTRPLSLTLDSYYSIGRTESFALSLLASTVSGFQQQVVENKEVPTLQTSGDVAVDEPLVTLPDQALADGGEPGEKVHLQLILPEGHPDVIDFLDQAEPLKETSPVIIETVQEDEKPKMGAGTKLSDCLLQYGVPEGLFDVENNEVSAGSRADEFFRVISRLPKLETGLEALNKRGNFNIWEMGMKNLYEEGPVGLTLKREAVVEVCKWMDEEKAVVDLEELLQPESVEKERVLLNPRDIESIMKWRKERAQEVVEYVRSHKDQLVNFYPTAMALNAWCHSGLFEHVFDILPVKRSEMSKVMPTMEMEYFQEKKYDMDIASRCLKDEYIPIRDSYYANRIKVKDMKKEAQDTLYDKAIDYIRNLIANEDKTTYPSSDQLNLDETLMTIGTGWEDLVLFGLYAYEYESSFARPIYGGLTEQHRKKEEEYYDERPLEITTPQEQESSSSDRQ